MASFSVNMDEVVKFTAKLEKLNRTAFPMAVRSTLNDVAFKTKELAPKIAEKNFTVRKKTLFKAFTTVNKASGYNVNQMKSETGINVAKGSKVAEGLEKQETGGTIQGRKLIAHDKARIGGSSAKRLKRRHQFKNISIARPGRKVPGGKYILIKSGGRGTVFLIKKLKASRRLTPIYSYRQSRNSPVPKNPFMSVAANMARAKMPEFYKKNAEYQFNRALK